MLPCVRVLVTGGTGFVGGMLCDHLRKHGHIVRVALRDDKPGFAPDEKVIVGNIGATTSWEDALEGVDVVMHLAARVHVLRDAAVNSARYMECNFEGTKALAEASHRAGVRRFIYLSSAKVNGEECEHAYTANDVPNPLDAYSVSKLAGENAIREVCAKGAMAFVIVRPPLIYGPGVRANFERLLGWTARGIPLPLGSVKNRRSFLSNWNLCSFLNHVIEHADASGVWMVSDGEDVSTADLVRRMALAMQTKARLLKVPLPVLRAAGRLLGRGDEVSRLCGSFTVDISDTIRRLNWTPPVTLDEGIERTAEWFLSRDHTSGS